MKKKSQETAVRSFKDLLAQFNEEWHLQDLLEAKGLMAVYQTAIESAQDPHELGLPTPGQQTVAVYRLRDSQGKVFQEVRVTGSDLERLEAKARTRMAQSLGFPDPNAKAEKSGILQDEAGNRYRIVSEDADNEEGAGCSKPKLGDRTRLFAAAIGVWAFIVLVAI